MTGRTMGSIDPGEVDAELAERAARLMSDYLISHPDDDPVEPAAETGGRESLVLPRATAVLFAQILEILANGRGVQIIPKDTELTTQQAATALNVSRPYLIGLLDSGQIPCRKVGRHRRVTLEALLAYKRQDDLKRRAAADELTRLSEELGAYR